MENEIIIKLINHLICLKLHYSKTSEYFTKYIINDRMKSYNADLLGSIQLNMDAVDFASYPEEYMDNFPYIEYGELIYPVSELLLSQNSFCFHGLALFWQGKAYIFTGKSGIGKSTQYMLWKELHPDEIRIINGDKPVLSFREDGNIYVYPSPWTGKENWGSRRAAPLGGIIYLSWGENYIRKMEQKEAVFPILQQIFYRLDTVESCHKVAELTEKLVQTIPIWNLQNMGDLQSAQMTYEFLKKKL